MRRSGLVGSRLREHGFPKSEIHYDWDEVHLSRDLTYLLDQVVQMPHILVVLRTQCDMALHANVLFDIW